jgi:hypothetical protein
MRVLMLFDMIERYERKGKSKGIGRVGFCGFSGILWFLHEVSKSV